MFMHFTLWRANMKKKRILIVATSALPIDKFYSAHIKRLALHNSLFLCFGSSQYQLPLSLSTYIAKTISIPLKRKPSPFHDFISLLLLIFLILYLRPNLIITTTPKAGLLTHLSAYLLCPKRIHYFTGQVWANSQSPLYTLYRYVDKTISVLATHHLVDSPGQLEFLRKQNILSSSQGCVLGSGSISGVDTSFFKPSLSQRQLFRRANSISPNEIVILYLGRIARAKGILELLTAFQSLSSTYSNITLLLVGPIEDQEFMSLATLHSSSSLNKVIYKPYTRTPQLFMQSSDIFCLPSHREGFGSVVIEASACQLPVVCSKIYGLESSIVDSETGLYFEPHNALDLAEKLNTFISSMQFRSDAGRKGRLRTLQLFEQNLVSRNFEHYITNLLSTLPR